MSQLWALVWLKWALFRNSMRSRRAAVGKLAALVGVLAGLLLSLVMAFGLGTLAYAFMLPTDEEVRRQAAADGFVFLFFIFTTAFVMWALMPLALGGGSRFEPGRMLLYPVSLGKLFAFDLASDLTSLTAVFAVPSIVAMGLGAGLASGRVGAGLAASLAAVAFGLGLAKLLSVGVGALMRRRRTRGETLLALLGALLGLTGALMGQLAPLMERYTQHFERLVWTPPGAAARAMTQGLRPGGEAAYFASVALLLGYAGVCVLLSYRVARRTALGEGGARRGGQKRAAAPAARQGASAGWRLPLVSAEVAAVFEKELRYAARNAQLRVIILMAVGLTVVLRMSASRGGIGLTTPYAEGAGTVFTVLYICMMMSPLTTNLFGYEGAGMRALVLSPVPRRAFLVGKNLALTLITAALVFAGVFVGGLIFRDLTWETALFALLAFASYAALFNAFGNWLSLQFPKRVEFGRRMGRTGVAGLLMVPFFVALLVLPVLAVLGAHLAGSVAVKYAILAAFATLSVAAYVLLLAPQGRQLARRELDILEAVTGRGGEGDTQVLG